MLSKKWGINSLLLPDNLVGDSDGVSLQINRAVSWTNYAKVWKPSATKRGLKIARVEFEVTNWDVIFRVTSHVPNYKLRTRSLTLLARKGKIVDPSELLLRKHCGKQFF